MELSFWQSCFGTALTPEAAFCRLLLGLVAGSVVGLERQARKQPAGFRTHVLICVASTLAMLISLYLPMVQQGATAADPGRIAAQVLTGMGFIGAGAILHMGVNVRGLTTAASIWSMAVLGLGIGAGLLWLSAVALCIILFTLFLLQSVEERHFPDADSKLLELVFEGEAVDSDNVRNLLLSNKLYILDFRMEYTLSSGIVILHYTLSVPKGFSYTPVFEHISRLPRLKSWKLFS
ncbi:MAG: MgtC/SapB family protein [Bacteroidales bacterium]